MPIGAWEKVNTSVPADFVDFSFLKVEEENPTQIQEQNGDIFPEGKFSHKGKNSTCLSGLSIPPSPNSHLILKVR